MQDFINEVYDFTMEFYNSIETYFTNDLAFNEFINKNIMNGSLINISLTYKELLTYVGGLVISILFIVFIINFIKGVLNIFTKF